MENNFNGSMNLGSAINSGNANVNAEPVVAPVFQTSTTGTSESVTITKESQPLGTVNNMHSQVIESTNTMYVNNTNVDNTGATTSAPVKTENNVNVEQSVVYDDTIVPVAILKNLVSYARKVGTYNPIRTISQVVGVELGAFGIKVNASNNNIDYECIDDTIKYNKTLKVTVDIQKLGDLLNNLDCETVKLNEVNGDLVIVMPEGSEYILPEKVDLQTQKPIELDLTFAMNYDDMIDLNLEKLIENINQSKPVRDLPKIDENFAGTYFSNLVLSSDRSIIYIQDNQPILKTQKFFIGDELCGLITSLNFNKAKFRIGFTTDSNNDIRAITLSDGKLTICGNVEPNSPIDEDVCNTFWNAKFRHNIIMSTKKLTYAIKRLKLFNENAKQDFANFEIANNTLKITLEKPDAKENLIVENNDTSYVGTIQLPLTRLETILNSIKSDKIILSTDEQYDGVIGIVADEFKWIMAAVGDEQ